MLLQLRLLGLVALATNPVFGPLVWVFGVISNALPKRDTKPKKTQTKPTKNTHTKGLKISLMASATSPNYPKQL